LVFEGDAFLVVFHEPSFRGSVVREDLEMVLRDELNTRSTWRFKARMRPMRANIVEPSDVATRIKASTAACYSSASCSAFGSLVM
jgi:hypothetical protein